MMSRGLGGTPTWCKLTAPVGMSTSTDCYLMILPLPLTLDAFPAPAEVSLLVCMSSPIYLLSVSHRLRSRWLRYVRLQELVAAFELFMLVLDNLDAINNLHQTGLESFGLSSKTVSLIRTGTISQNAKHKRQKSNQEAMAQRATTMTKTTTTTTATARLADGLRSLDTSCVVVQG